VRVQAGVHAAKLEQLGMLASFYNLAVFQYDDLVRIPDSAQTVRDNEACAST
jgi:hypothetical protein